MRDNLIQLTSGQIRRLKLRLKARSDTLQGLSTFLGIKPSAKNLEVLSTQLLQIQYIVFSDDCFRYLPPPCPTQARSQQIDIALSSALEHVEKTDHPWTQKDVCNLAGVHETAFSKSNASGFRVKLKARLQRHNEKLCLRKRDFASLRDKIMYYDVYCNEANRLSL